MAVKIICYLFGILNIILVAIGTFSKYSFEEWIIIDIVLISSNLISVITFWIIRNINAFVHLAIIIAFIFGFVTHRAYDYWSFLDLAVIGISIWSIFISRNLSLPNKNK